MTHTQIIRCGVFRRTALAGGALMLATAGARAATLHVPGNYSTLADAVVAATIGDTIAIGAGQFPANLVFTKSLTLEGAGAAKTTLDGGQAGTVLTTTPGVTLTVRDLTIRGGKAPAAFGHGGGVLNDGDLRMERCVIRECSAPVSGGGLSNVNGTARLVACLLRDNVAGLGGAIDNNATLMLENCTLAANEATTGAGVVNTGQLEVINTTLFANSAQAAGGMYLHSGTTSIRYSTLANNNAYGALGDGGGVLALTPFTAQGALIARNTAAATGPDVRGSMTSIGYNLVGNASGAAVTPVGGAGPDQKGSAANPIDPRLGALKDNGGPVPTMMPAANSPAVDKGGAIDIPAWDARGAHRPRDGGSGQLLADAGAVELGPLGYTATDLRRALQITAGMVNAGANDAWLNVDAANAAVDLNDCAHIARRAIGLDK